MAKEPLFIEIVFFLGDLRNHMFFWIAMVLQLHEMVKCLEELLSERFRDLPVRRDWKQVAPTAWSEGIHLQYSYIAVGRACKI